MRAAPATEVSAAKAREHLIAFVKEMVAGLPHVRQRKNAARYESVQQFLAHTCSPTSPSSATGSNAVTHGSTSSAAS